MTLEDAISIATSLVCMLIGLAYGWIARDMLASGERKRHEALRKEYSEGWLSTIYDLGTAEDIAGKLYTSVITEAPDLLSRHPEITEAVVKRNGGVTVN